MKSIKINTLILSIVVLSTITIHAQYSNLIGYWKNEISASKRVLYIAFLENGLSKSVVVSPRLERPVIQQYSIEGQYLTMKQVIQSGLTTHWTMNWLSNDEINVYYILSNQKQSDTRHHYTRISQEQYEQQTGFVQPLLSSANPISPKDDIIGYWKKEELYSITSFTATNYTTYYHFIADGSAKTMTTYADRCFKNSFKYWFEGSKYYIQYKNNSIARQLNSYWVSSHEFCLNDDNASTYRRITQEEFERVAQYVENCPTSATQTDTNPINIPTQQQVGFKCMICLDTGRVLCGKCGGKGKVPYADGRGWFTCSFCSYGYSKCDNFQCPSR